MTQHIDPQHTLEDQTTWRRLAMVIASFIAITAVGAISVSLVAG